MGIEITFVLITILALLHCIGGSLLKNLRLMPSRTNEGPGNLAAGFVIRSWLYNCASNVFSAMGQNIKLPRLLGHI